MSSTALHPILLTFRDENLERDFRSENDLKMVLFYRIGIYLGFVSWMLAGVLCFLIYPQFIALFALSVGIGLFPLFTLIIVLSYYEKYWPYYQRLVALANFIAAVLAIFMAAYLADYALMAVTIPLFVLLAHFILRLRFKIALIITVLYTALAQLTMLILNNYSADDVFYTTLGFATGLIAANLGGYFLEQTTRRSFVQKRIIQGQQEALEQEKQKSEQLLLNILPEEIADQLKNDQEAVVAKSFKSISVLFADIVNFTKMSNNMSPREIVIFLNGLFVLYDDLAEKYGLEKIKTIGDAYMVGAGIPLPDEGHADKILSFSIAMLKATQDFNQKLGKQISIRVGIHSGPAVAGVIGTKKFLYDLWGDTVNTASRMESSGVGDKIQVTADTYQLTRDQFDFEERGAIDIKGKGKMLTYFLLGKKT